MLFQDGFDLDLNSIKNDLFADIPFVHGAVAGEVICCLFDNPGDYALGVVFMATKQDHYGMLDGLFTNAAMLH